MEIAKLLSPTSIQADLRLPAQVSVNPGPVLAPAVVWPEDAVTVAKQVNGQATALKGLFESPPIARSEVTQALDRLRIDQPAEWQRAIESVMADPDPVLLAALLDLATQKPALQPPDMAYYRAQAQVLLSNSEVPLDFCPQPQAAAILRAVQAGISVGELSRSEIHQIVARASQDARHQGNPLLMDQLAQTLPAASARHLRQEAFDLAWQQQNLPVLVQLVSPDSQAFESVCQLARLQHDLPAFERLAQKNPARADLLQDAMTLAQSQQNGHALARLAQLTSSPELRTRLERDALALADKQQDAGLMYQLLQANTQAGDSGRILAQAVDAALSAKEPGLMLDLLVWRTSQPQLSTPSAYEPAALYEKAVDLAREKNSALLPMLISLQLNTPLNISHSAYASHRIFAEAAEQASPLQSLPLLALQQTHPELGADHSAYAPDRIFEKAADLALAKPQPQVLSQLAAAQQQHKYSDRTYLQPERLLKSILDFDPKQPVDLAEAAWLAHHISPAPTGDASPERLLRDLVDPADAQPEALLQAIKLGAVIPGASSATEPRILARRLLKAYGYY